MAVDTLGHLLALRVTPANEQERAQVRELAQDVQRATGETVKVAFVDQGYTGQEPAQAAQAEGIDLQVIKLPEAKKGFVLLPKRWVVERSFGWANEGVRNFVCRAYHDHVKEHVCHVRTKLPLPARRSTSPKSCSNDGSPGR
jgi:transposase